MSEPPAHYSGPGINESVDIPSGGQALFDAVREGFPFETYNKLAKATGLEKRLIAEYAHIPPATLSRRARAGQFSTEESDRLYRLMQIIGAAIELFNGDKKSALQWAEKPAPGLANRRPIEMAGTSVEAQAVLTLIRRLELGIIT